MGFSGHLVFGRSEHPLLGAPVFDGIHQASKDTVHTWWPRSGGWQTLQFDHGLWEDDDLPALVEWTGAPACAAGVHDSDVALVTGLGTDGQQWRAWLNLDAAASIFAEEPDDLDDVSRWVGTPEFDEAVRRKRTELEAEVPASAEGALLWAAAAGVPATAEKPRIEEFLRSREVFVEDLFSAMLNELGFPEAIEPPQP